MNIRRSTTMQSALAACAMLLTTTGVVASPVEAEALRILNRYCAGCHNANDAEGDFSLADYASLMKGTAAGKVIVPGDPAGSKLLQLMTGDLEPAMPPEDEDQPSASEIDLVRKWISEGATGPSTTQPMQIDVPKLPPAQTTYVGSACSINGNTAIGSLGQVQLIEAGSAEPIWTVSDLPGKVNSLRLSSQGDLVAATGLTGVGGLVVVIDPSSGRVLKEFEGHADAVYCAALSPDGQLLATGSYDRKILIRDARSGELLHELTGHNGAIYDLDFSSDGRLLVTASADQTVKLWSVPEFQRLDTFGQPEGEVYCVRFSSDGEFVIAGGADRQIRKWKVVSRDKPAINPMVRAVYAHESALQVLVVTEKVVVSAANDTEVKQWNADTLAPLGTAQKLTGIPVALDVSANGTSIAVTLTGNVQQIALAEAAGPKVVDASGTSNTPKIEVTAGEARTAKAASYDEREMQDNREIQLPAKIAGVISAAQERDTYAFNANAGENWIFEVDTPKNSPLDSWLEVLDQDGKSVLRTRLQAVRESYFTFRGKDSSTSDDFRMHRWEDMELDEYLYSSGEVTRLWLYPRGPDSGFKVYPGTGARHTFFGTTPISHALGEPAYIVRQLAAEETPLPNGLPVFPIYFENDDDPLRRIGKDSRLTFTAPRTGQYQLQVRDARGFGGPDFEYKIDLRVARPDFDIKVQGGNLSVAPGSGSEWTVTATRKDGLSGPIRINLSGLPEGFVATNPLIIEENQAMARGTIYATKQALVSMQLPEGNEHASGEDVEASEENLDDQEPKDESAEKAENNENPPKYQTVEIQLSAVAEAAGGKLEKELPPLKLTLTDTKQLQFRVVSLDGQPVERLTIAPGETISAKIILSRNGDKSAVSFGKDDSGRNLPHGAYVDNIGLNGLLIPAQYNEREFFITAAPKLRPGTVTQFHLRTAAKGNATSRPITIEVVPPMTSRTPR